MTVFLCIQFFRILHFGWHQRLDGWKVPDWLMTSIQKGILCHTFHWGFINIVGSWYFLCEIVAQQHPSTKAPWSFVNKKRLWQTISGSALWTASNGAAAGGWVGCVGAPKLGKNAHQEMGEEFDMHLLSWKWKQVAQITLLPGGSSKTAFSSSQVTFSFLQFSQRKSKGSSWKCGHLKPVMVAISAVAKIWFQLPRLGRLQEVCPQGRCHWKTFCLMALMAHVCCDVFSIMRNPLLWTLLKDACFEPCFKDVTRFLVEIHQNNHRQIYVSSNTSVGSVLSIIELGCKGIGSNWLATRHGRQVRGVVVSW